MDNYIDKGELDKALRGVDALESRVGVDAGTCLMRAHMLAEARKYDESVTYARKAVDLAVRKRPSPEALPYVFVGTLDGEEWPIATVLEGDPGFVESLDPVTLRIQALPATEDPAAGTIVVGRDVGILGIDLGTRRRNRVNGVVSHKTTPAFIVELPLSVTQAEAREMGVRLELGRQLYNACLGEGLRRLERLREGPAWARACAMPRMKDRKPNKERADARVGAHECQVIAQQAFSAVDLYAFGKRGRPRFKGKGRPLHSLLWLASSREI